MEIQGAVEPDPEPEFARFVKCRDCLVKFILWKWGDSIHLRRWAGQAHCGDMIACYDGIERMRLCEKCAESPGLNKCFLVKLKGQLPVHCNQL
jgi:hypothetical protein